MHVGKEIRSPDGGRNSSENRSPCRPLPTQLHDSGSVAAINAYRTGSGCSAELSSWEHWVDLFLHEKAMVSTWLLCRAPLLRESMLNNPMLLPVAIPTVFIFAVPAFSWTYCPLGFGKVIEMQSRRNI